MIKVLAAAPRSKKRSGVEAFEIPPARKPRYFEWPAHQRAEKRIGQGLYICQS